MEEYVYDVNFTPVLDADESKGTFEQRTISVSHKYVVDVEEEGHWEVIAEYPETGGKDVEWKVDTPESGHWATYRDDNILFEDYPGLISDDWPHDQDVTDTFNYILYTPYTEEELAQIAKDKAETERQNKIAELKYNLSSTDYILTKMVEYNVSGTPMPEDDAARYAEIINQRAQWRKEINELEDNAPVEEVM